MQAIRRLQQRLGPCGSAERGDHREHPEKPHDLRHARSLAGSPATRKEGSRPSRFRRPRGTLLVETTLSLAILTIIGLSLLQLSLNILRPRQWTLQQAVSDAYLTFERSYAERISFEELLANDSPWPAWPSKSQVTVEIGRLPGNRPLMGTVTRTRRADPDNYPIDGGSGTVNTNPAAMKVWKVQSVLSYQIDERTYVKSRAVVRSQ